MAELYRFVITVEGNLSETEAERLDVQLDGRRNLGLILQAAVERNLALTTFTDKSQYDLSVKVEAVSG